MANIHTVWENFTQLDVSSLHVALALRYKIYIINIYIIKKRTIDKDTDDLPQRVGGGEGCCSDSRGGLQLPPSHGTVHFGKVRNWQIQ